MKRKLALTALLLAMISGGASARIAAPKIQTVKIGTFEYDGTNDQGESTFIINLDSSLVTSQPLSFGNVSLTVGGVEVDSGPVATPVQLLGVGGPGFTLPSCQLGCQSAAVQILTVDGHPFTFNLLKSNKSFTEFGVVSTDVLVPQPGQAFITPGQKVDIVVFDDVTGQ